MGLNLKQLKGLLLFLSCIFFLPLLQEESPFISSGSQAILRAHFSDIEADPVHLEIADNVDQTQCFTSNPGKYNHRTRALNDYHELCLFVPIIRIKSLFVYIHPAYKGYKESYISVSVTLSDWRGPPLT